MTISYGPLSYKYTLSHLTLHYGREISTGSEHTINGVQFPGELQLYAYNSQLYGSWEEAAGTHIKPMHSPAMCQQADDPRTQLQMISKLISSCRMFFLSVSTANEGRAHGIAALAILIQISADPRNANNQLKRITHALKNITQKGEEHTLRSMHRHTKNFPPHS